jgi:hypothetical protein
LFRNSAAGRSPRSQLRTSSGTSTAVVGDSSSRSVSSSNISACAALGAEAARVGGGSMSGSGSRFWAAASWLRAPRALGGRLEKAL